MKTKKRTDWGMQCASLLWYIVTRLTALVCCRSRSHFLFAGSFFCFVFIHVAGEEAGQHGTGDLVHSSTYSSRDSDGRSEVDGADGKSQGIILHADFQGNGMLLPFAKTELASDEIAKSKTEEIV